MPHSHKSQYSVWLRGHRKNFESPMRVAGRRGCFGVEANDSSDVRMKRGKEIGWTRVVCKCVCEILCFRKERYYGHGTMRFSRIPMNSN